MKTTASDNAIQILEEKSAQLKGDFTLQDAAGASGLSVDEAKTALDALMAKYNCRLKLTENGDLIYSFGPSLKRRGVKTWAEKAAALGEWLWKAFTIFYKAWIAITLVVYFAIFLVLLIAFIVASTSGKDSKKSSINLGSVFDVFFSIFRWRTTTSMINYQMDRQGYRYKQYESRRSPLNENKKSFMASVYDFVFGPARVTLDPLANEKEVAAYLRREKGIVTASELIALAGWNREEAEQFLSECLVRFQGDPLISENGIVFGRFDQITRSTTETADGKIEFYWDEYEPEYEITGNTGTRNALIIFMNFFNLTFASVIVKNFLYPSPDLPIAISAAIVFWLGWVPIVFSFLFFAIPIARLFRITKKRAHRTAMNIRKRIMRVLFGLKEKSASLEPIITGVNATGSEQKISAAQAETALQAMMRDFEGEVQLSNDGTSRFAFPRIAEEFEEAQKLRSGRIKEKNLGVIISDSQA